MFGKPNRYQCKVCKGMFKLEVENRYTAVKAERSGLSLLANGPGTTYFDAFDCPFCGCQNIVGVREETQLHYFTTITTKEEDE